MSEPVFVTKTRASFDAVAGAYAATFSDELDGKPLDRALLGAFAELVPDGPVVDVGCGPGYVTAHLTSLGLDISGIDLSPGMVEVAQRAYPSVRFSVGSMLGLDLPDGSLAGLVAYYSIVNIPRAELPVVFAEFARVLAPGGVLLMVFQVGDEVRHGTEWLGHPIDLHVYRNQPDVVAEQLAEVGLAVRMSTVRQPDDDGVEVGPRAYLLATRLSGDA
ncbi:class I SAM-dependent DNA methyltransferase [Petropleomorpha daqingensis]|uniref:Ubiquinone/menaquinone biosynthesis C-methylase UbiE n=1 Tax=Petropleomorpha daqingensis TaxID=2026353 RepID=A0A853CJN6_9ACTN|nr:ubiquinone/menaquinone biosynthesis C-methylase UbiE [Petropleomorpha daqingensis]